MNIPKKDEICDSFTLGYHTNHSHRVCICKRKARELAKYLRAERTDYAYLNRLFQYLREELEIEMPKATKKSL